MREITEFKYISRVMNSLEGSDGHKSVRTSLKNLSDSQTESMNVKDH